MDSGAQSAHGKSHMYMYSTNKNNKLSICLLENRVWKFVHLNFSEFAIGKKCID